MKNSRARLNEKQDVSDSEIDENVTPEETDSIRRLLSGPIWNENWDTEENSSATPFANELLNYLNSYN